MRRSKTIDALKGIAIFSVVLGHITLTPPVLKIWLYSFHIPLFFLCSGLIFSIEKYPSFAAFLKRKLKSIIIPYFCLGLSLWLLSRVYLTLNKFFYGTGSVSWDIGHLLLSLLLGYRLHRFYFSLWFLCVLFVAELIYYFVVKWAKEDFHKYSIVFLAAIIVQWLVFKHVRGCFWSLDLVPTGIAFLSMGTLFRLANTKYGSHLRQKRFLLVSFTGSVLTCYLNYRFFGKTDLYYCKIGNPVLFGCAALLGSWFVIILVTHLGDFRPLEYFGKNSLVTYAFQNSFSIPSAKLAVNMIANRTNLLSDITTEWILISAFTMIISAVLIEVINRLFPWMLGKTKCRNKQFSL